MKTDRFTDIIRRKLESIRPEFTDKDWARMQSTLRNANVSPSDLPGANHSFSGGIWSGQSWLLAAASISTIALIAFSIWQRREINQLHQTIGQLHPKSTNQSAPAFPNTGSKEQVRSDRAQSDGVASSKQPQGASLANRNESQAVRPDTVYITQYVVVPSRAKPEVRNEERLSQHLETPTEQRYATENPASPSVITRQPATLIHNQQTESHDESSTPSVAKNIRNESTVTNKSANTSASGNSPITQSIQERDTKRSDTSPATSVDKPTNVVANNPAVSTESSAATNETSANYNLVASLPLAIGTKNWNTVLAQRAKRMQPVRPIPIAEPAQVPSSQPVKRMAARLRAGVGGEIATRLWSAGVFTEVLMGRNWTLGVGLSQATYLNRFITDEDFDNRTQRDFRKEFGRGIDPWRDILNIDTRQLRLQIPLNLGYRIPLNQTLTLTPTVGTYLNLDNLENVTFYCRQIQRPPMQPQFQRGYDEFAISKTQPVSLINNLSLGAGLEWQRGHWVVQATPVLTIPMQNDLKAKQTDLNWQKNTTVGLRARLLYQF